jgi:hypothetical protein
MIYQAEDNVYLRAGMTTPAAGWSAASTPHDEEELKRLALELLEMALDFGGLIDPTPFCDSTASLLALTQGRWLDAALSGLGIIPYVGDLAKGGKFPRYLRTMDKVEALLARSRRAAEALQPAFARMEIALNWLPAQGSTLLAMLKQRVRALRAPGGKAAKRFPLPDISGRFQFPEPVTRGGFVYRTAHGRLGVPGKVKVHRRASVTHKDINKQFPGDDAGHLLGARFGAPDEAANLIASNYRMNRGTFNHTIEAYWDRLLRQGTGVEATVEAKFRLGEARPISWHAKWVEITPRGQRITRDSNVFYMNPETVKSRSFQQ